MSYTSTGRGSRGKAEETGAKVGEAVDQAREDIATNGESTVEAVTTKLKSVGVDTDQMAAAARGQASELQRMLANEVQANPLRTLGIAAAVGVFVGLLTAR